MIEEVSLYKTSDGTTFECEEDAYNYETEYALKKAKVRIFDADMQEITKDDYSSGTRCNVCYIVAGDSSEEDVNNAGDMIFDWVDSSVDPRDIKPNTTIVYDHEADQWINMQQYEARIEELADKLYRLRQFSESVQA